ncbi:MAG: malonate decarboxylase holo-[acyl-carrier-protein] synthase [Caulobacteraceae bacterium]|nr:malonate decarboxylase holo-[acyl-carrier-protein] synthase [Caulobacter sp.]
MHFGRHQEEGEPLLAAFGAGDGDPGLGERRAAGEPFDAWPVALSLFPARSRFASCLPPGAVDRHAPPPFLIELTRAGTLPAAWQPRVDAVLTLGRESGAVPRVFGSALWQHLSGHSCLRPDSDLDLLWCGSELSSPSAVDTLLAGLARLADGSPRLDGELLLADGSGVQWRELAAASPGDEILLKAADGVRMVQARTVRDLLPA